MSDSLTTVLRTYVLPAVEALTEERLVLPNQAGKRALGPYPLNASATRTEVDRGVDLPEVAYRYEGHPIPEVAFCVRGRAELALAGNRYALTEGDTAIVAPRTPHLERILDRNQGYHLLWIRVAPDHLGLHASSYSRGNRFQLVGGASIPRSGAMGRCFEAAAEETVVRAPLWIELVRARLIEGLVLAIRHLETHGAGLTPEDSKRGMADVAKAFIQSRFSEDLSLEQIAREVYLSPNYFSSLFTQAEGKTVFEYLHEIRLDEARRLLAETEMPIREIARRVGIPSPSYFCRLFKRTVGQTAHVYRTRATGRSRP
jgi:AraC-like DNA-binding protein